MMPRREEAGPEGPNFPSEWRSVCLLLGLAVAAGAIAAVPPRAGSSAVNAKEHPGTAAVATKGGSNISGAAESLSARGKKALRAAGAAARACVPGKNGGETDVGVTPTSIKLGATIALTGIGASFLGDVRFAMQAVKDQVNRSGGICGRKLLLELVDDAWDFERGGTFLRNLVEDRKVFALAVVPSSEGLKNISDAGYLRRRRIPVVGSDGMLIHQYTDPFIWPVAASTISTMHIMAAHAWNRGSRNFAIVYERTYHFGVEGAYAFNQAYRRLTAVAGKVKDVPGYPAGERDGLRTFTCRQRFCAIDANDNDYSDENQTIARACQGSSELPRCDFVALLLEPTTALKWMKVSTFSPAVDFVAGPQPLFTRDFGNACGRKCAGLWLWTGYHPPVGQYLRRPAVSRYVRDLKSTNPNADYNNPFVQGGYVGMSLLVKALQRLGSDVTRKGLAQTLDSMT